eukprot:2724796-Pleurochrysis_carterae.AAC.1
MCAPGARALLASVGLPAARCISCQVRLILATCASDTSEIEWEKANAHMKDRADCVRRNWHRPTR